jgi:hypothetical protein
MPVHPTLRRVVRAAILVLLVAALPGAAAAAQIQTGEDVEGLQPDWLQDALDDYWEDVFDDAGLEYEAPDLLLYEDEVETGCVDAEAGTTPFYCPADGTVYIAAERYDAVTDARGETFWVIEVANLWGSAIIWQLGLSDEPDDEPAGGSEDDPFLQWCLGGAFVDSGVEDDLLEADDVDETIEALIDDEFDEDAIDALETGYEEGLEGCDLDFEGAGGDSGPAGFYESPLYGYTITYDADEWEPYQEDDDPDDEYDKLYLTNGPSLLFIVGDPDYDEDDLDDCLDDYGTPEGEDGVSDVEPLDERDAEGDEDDLAWVTYTYTLEFEDGSEDDFTRYYSCRYLGDGLTLVVIHDAPAADYEDEVEARESMLEGFELADGDDGDSEDEDEGD